MRKTYPNEVDKKLFFILKRIYKEVFNNDGARIFDDYIVKGTKFNGGALFTLFKNDMPILTTAPSKYENHEVWELLHETATMPLKTNSSTHIEAPFIADRLEVGAIQDLDAMKWTGDFSKCIGWVSLDPNKIR